MTRNSFALTLIAALFVAGPLMAEPDSKKEPTKRTEKESKKSPSSNAAAVSRVLTVRDITIFTYQPAPTRAIDTRRLRDEGLVRISINPQGVVTAVKLLRSTGNRDFDTDAADAFRRWRTRPGPAREIDLPITSVTTGKKAPMRLPMAEGTLDVG